MAIWNKLTQAFTANGTTLFETQQLATKDGAIVDGDNPLPVSIGGESVTITGDVTIPGTIAVTSDASDPVHNHITQVGTGAILAVDYLPVGGTVSVDNFPGVGTAGANKPFYLEVAQGLISGTTSNHKFGAVPLMGGNTTGTIWDIDDTFYPWSALDTPAVVNVERNDVADNGLIVTVQGLDTNWDFVEEEITISAADQLGSTLFRRVNRAFITDTGSTNAGDIDIEAGAAGGTIVARITEGLGQTLMGAYTIPAGKTAYLLKINTSAQDGKDASGFLYVRATDTTTFQIKHTWEFSGAAGPYQYNFAVPLVITEKSDIDVRATTRDNNGRYTVSFDILLVDNPA